MLDRAKANVIPDTHATELEMLVTEFGGIFSTEFQRTPAKLEPIRIEPRPMHDQYV